MADVKLSAKVIGVKELQAILKESDRKMLRSTQASMRKAASPMTSQAKSMTPSATPLSGWAHKGRTGWRQSEVLSGISTAVGGRAVSRTVWPLLSLQQKNPAGMIYDWAGRTNAGKRPLQQFVKLLPALGGVKGSQYSRVLFPAFVATRDEVVRAVQDGIDEVAKQLNIEIERI
jgi:hypothetical protein